MTSISIITITYNAENTIEDCIQSIDKQNYNAEHIIVDGASTDGTLDLIKLYSDIISVTISEPDNGIYDAMNKGIKMSSGDIVGILNSDDFYSNNDVLSNVAKAFDDPNIDSCYGDLKYVDGNDVTKLVRYWKSGNYNSKKFYNGWMPPHPTFFVRRSVYEKYGLFNLDLGSAADYEIMLRFLLKHKVKAKYIPETLVHMRTGGVSNASIKNRLKANHMDRKAWKVNDLKPYPWTLAMKPLRKLGQWIT